ncbi:hypothetical protein HYE54_03670 [Aggregatibacter actinomycetemcomitans]|uniref:hypothetical protein n=1 Tax=Aggregatibacter actinomycetemcomitans TaxID=714 RepID=UPI00197B0AAE|nr:hypothetical protein [Aggregatibacter actinomycetemcomitans]MBN6067882.1 hypothetical protein [Aggregatibacter actinomycetemcomitans]MBN6085819.1 hypothetical protein [Aggregatibacter actinomycetemcomitans]
MKIYFLKENTKEYVIYPEPEDKENYHEIDVADGVDLDTKRLVDKNGKMVLVDAPENDFYTWNGRAWTISKKNQTALLQTEKAALILQLAAKTDELKAELLVGYPETEIDSFYRQEKEALAWQADKNAETPMLTKIAEKRGVPFEILVKKVIEKASLFAGAIGDIIGLRQRIEDRINAATEQAELDVIKKEVKSWQLQKQN